MRKRSRLERAAFFCGLLLVVSAVTLTAFGWECLAQTSKQASQDRGELSAVLKGRLDVKDAWQSLPSAEEIKRQTQAMLSRPLSPEDALRIALLNHSGLQAEVQQLGVRHATAYQKSVLLNPTLSGSVWFEDGSVGEIDAALLFDLAPLFYLGLERSGARRELEITRLEVGAAVISFVGQVRVAYFECVANGQLLTVARLDVEAMQAAARAAELLYEAGNLTEFELSMQRVRAAEAQTSLLDARGAWQTSRRRLQQMLGIDSEQEWSVPAQLPEFEEPVREPETLTKQGVAQSLRLQSLRLDQDLSRTRLKLAAWQGWIPTLEVGVSGQADFGQTNEYLIGPAIQIQLPFFGPPVEFEAKIVKSELEYRAERRSIELQANELYEQMQLAVERMEHLRDHVLPLRVQVFEQAQLQFNASAIDVFELLATRQMHIQTQRDYIATLRDSWVLHAQLETLLAGGKPGQR